MKYLNLAYFAVLIACMVSCNNNSNQKSHVEETDSMEIEEEIITDELDESEYLDAAMNALEAGNNNLAIDNVMKAIENIKGYIDEMDDPKDANYAIATLTDIASKLKTGSAMTKEDFQAAIMKLEYFSDEDMEIEEVEIEEKGE